MERRDLKDERIQIPNEDLTVEMFDIDKKDFESGDAFLKADMKVKKNILKQVILTTLIFIFLNTTPHR